MLQTNSEEFDAFDALLEDIKICDAIENIHTHTKALSKQKKHARSEFKTETIVNFIQKTVDHCKGIRKRNCREEEEYVSDERLSKLARFTDKMALKPFELFLQYVPRLVNVVTVYLSHGLSLPTVSLSLTVSHRLSSFLFFSLVAACRSVSSTRERNEAATRPRSDCKSVLRRLLCTEAILGSPIGVYESKGESAHLPYVPLQNCN